MSRISFSQVLKSASIDIRREYDRLYGMFFLQRFQENQYKQICLRDYCAENFIRLPFRGTCISLDDFDDFYGYHFEKVPAECDIDYLISFCEYTYNLAIYSQGMGFPGYDFVGSLNLSQPIQFYVQQVMTVIEAVGYMSNAQGGITDFVPKDQAAISVAEIIDPDLSYRVIEYNHYSMKGDLDRKKNILLALSDKLESQRSALKQANSALESDLFYLFNKVNIRHNNIDKAGKKYKPYAASMDKETLEKWYDDTYQMCLLAFLEIDHLERKSRVKQLKTDNPA